MNNQFTLHLGDKIKIIAAENPTTGYTWQISSTDNTTNSDVYIVWKNTYKTDDRVKLFPNMPNKPR